MIQQGTILKVSDNSGAKTVKCLKILGGFKKKYATLGDLITVSVKQLRNKLKKTSKVKKKEICKALIIRIKVKFSKNGYEKNFKENAVVLINKQENPIGTKIFGSIPKFLRKKKLQKFISISTNLI